MDRRGRFYALVAAALLAVLADSALAQHRPVPQGGRPTGGAPGPSSRALGQGNQRWRQMSPSDRQQFRSNIQRWRNLSPQARQDLRAMEIARQQQLKREAEAAMREAGLKMEAEKRAQFEQRYLQERKRVEQELRRELKEKREREMAPVVERLRKEFAEPSATPSPRAEATVSPSPTK